MRLTPRSKPQPRHIDRSDAGRVPEITTKFGGRTAEVPQSYYDFTATDAVGCCGTINDLGPYSHTAIADGSWSNPAIWDTGTVPGAGAVVEIGSRDVIYDVESDAKVKDIHVGGPGTFRWDVSKDTRLWVDTLLCLGTFLMGAGYAPVADSATPGKPRAEIVLHQTEAPGSTPRLGLIWKGYRLLVGAPKADRLLSDKDIPAGSTSAKIRGVRGANWRVGDVVQFGSTDYPGVSMTDPQYSGPTQFWGPYQGTTAVRTQTFGFMQSHSERRTITAVVGSTITWAEPLEHDHVLTKRTLPHGQVRVRKPVIACLTGSIRIRSEDPSSSQKRGHTMAMHHDGGGFWDVEFKDLGRTNTDPSLALPDGTPVRATNGGTIITNPNNVRGRYPIHLHWMGAHFGRKQFPVKRCKVWGDAYPIDGWGITHHAGRAAVENCVVSNVRGAGIVSELGNETGQWMNNTVIGCRGDGYPVSWGSRAELFENHNGHAGVGYESQARQVFQQGNIAIDCNFGWMFMQQNVKQSTRVPDMYSMRNPDPVVSGRGSGSSDPEFSMDEDTYGIEQAQIIDFYNNACYGCRFGFGVAHRQFTDRTDTTPMIARNFDCVATETPFHLINYTFFYSFYDFMWTGTGASAAARLGSVSWQQMFVNGYLENYSVGFQQEGLGFNYDGYWIDVVCDPATVPTPFTHFTGDFDLTAWIAANPGKAFPQDQEFYGLMGPWITDPASTPTRWIGTLREWKSLNSATDLPVNTPAAPRGLGGVEPSPGTSKPYFWLDPTSDITLSTSGIISIKGAIVDSVGVRLYPDVLTSESFGPMSSHSNNRYARQNGNTPEVLVKRNGCWNDNGTWKTRCWFTEHDRLTGEYFQFHVDLLLHSSMDPSFLAGNVVDPNLKPELPLRAESIGVAPPPVVIDTTAPTITSADTASVTSGATLALVLKAAEIHPSWSIIGGADQAQFEINKSVGVSTLRWLGNGTMSSGSPADADDDNEYEVQVAAANPYGNGTPQSIRITVNA